MDAGTGRLRANPSACRLPVLVGLFLMLIALSLGRFASAADSVDDVSKWPFFTSKSGWSLKYPPALKIGTCRQCPDARAPGVLVIFSEASGSDSVLVEPLADKPPDKDLRVWLLELGKTSAGNRMGEEWFYLDGRLALRVTNQAPGSTSENVYVANGSKSLAIRISSSDPESFYPAARQALSTFRFSN